MGRILIIWCLVCGLAATVRAEAPETVGRLGNPKQIEFVGNTTFAAADLRSALGRSVEYLMAGHPDAPLPAYLKSVEQLLRRAYLAQGFAEVAVAARRDEGSDFVHVSISEGPRYTCGPVEILGAKTLPVEKFRNLLASVRSERPARTVSQGPPPPRTAIVNAIETVPIWVEGRPAAFRNDEVYLEQKDFREILKSLGYHAPDFLVTTRIDPGNSVVLIVNFSDEGPRALLRTIDIQGTASLTADSIRDHLDLKPGTPLTADLATEIESRLWDSARFRDYDVRFLADESDVETLPSVVRITVREIDRPVPFTDDLSPLQDALLPFAGWFDGFEQSEHDLVLEATSSLKDLQQDAARWPDQPMTVRLRAAVSPPNKSALFVFELLSPLEEVTRFWTIEAIPDAIVLHSSKPPQKLTFGVTHQQFLLWIMLNTSPPGTGTSPGGFSTSWQLKPMKQSGMSPFLPSLSIAPALLLQFPKVYAWSLDTEGGIATIKSGQKPVFKFEVESGRLLEFDLSLSRSQHLSARTERDALKHLRATIDSAIGESDASQVNERPISSVLTFALRQFPEATWSDLLRKVLDRDGLRAFDQFEWNELLKPDIGFRVPPQLPSGTPAANWGWCVYPISRLLLPATVEYHQLPFEVAAGIASDKTSPSASFLRIAQETTPGPLWCLAAEASVGRVFPDVRGKLASRGIACLTWGEIDRELQNILNHDWPLGHLLLTATEVLQSYEPGQLAALADELPVDAYDRRQWKKVFATFHTHKDLPPEEALRKALHVAWAPLIEWRLEGLLTSLTR